MSAIYKRELRSYFTSVIACLFIAVTTLIAGIFFVYYNLTYGLTEMYSAYQSLLILVFTIPILTMKIIADERRLKTDQLILTAPISVGKIVIGKFMALVTIYVIPLIVMCLYPVILSRFGHISFKMSYTNILGLFLYGIALLSIGMFISSITESQVIAAILSIVVLFIGYIMSSVSTMISADGNIFTKILSAFDLLTPANNFMNGILKLSDIIYYLSIAVLFIFLTCQSIQKRRWNVTRKTISTGVFSSTYIVVFLIVTVFVNLVAGKITENAEFATADITESHMYSITDDTKAMLKKLKSNITIYVLVSEKSRDETIDETLKRYESASKHIKVEYKDTTLNPNFYSDYTDTAPTENSLIVVNDSTNKSRVVDHADIYQVETDYTTYQSTVTGYDCEGQLDSAIAYVVSEKTPIIYQIEGHDEVGMGENVKAAIEKMNSTIETIKLPGMDSISVNDCACLLILGPTKDYTKEDADKVIHYLNAGGKAIIGIEAYQSASVDKPNFQSILKAFGAATVDGVVAELDSSYYASSYGPFFVLANGTTGYASSLTNS